MKYYKTKLLCLVLVFLPLLAYPISYSYKAKYECYKPQFGENVILAKGTSDGWFSSKNDLYKWVDGQKKGCAKFFRYKTQEKIEDATGSVQECDWSSWTER